MATVCAMDMPQSAQLLNDFNNSVHHLVLQVHQDFLNAPVSTTPTVVPVKSAFHSSTSRNGNQEARAVLVRVSSANATDMLTVVDMTLL